MKKIIIVSCGLLLALVLVGCSLTKTKSTVKELTLDEAKAKAEKFINENLVSAGSEVKVSNAVVEGDLYKLSVTLTDGQVVYSYLSKNGQTFFPEAMDIAETVKQAQQAANTNSSTTQSTATVTVTAKSDKPTVELFVMSQCPYGTQIEKGILPVLDLLKDKISFELKFCSYAMHGEEELQEEMSQYCIQKEQGDKFQSYLECFLTAGESDQCLTQVAVDKTGLDKCTSDTDKEFKVTENYNDKSTWQGNYPSFAVYQADNEKYGVQGSPTLVINGETISSGRDSQSLLKAICSAFNTAPAECSQSLSSSTPAAGFGSGTTNSNSANACE